MVSVELREGSQIFQQFDLMIILFSVVKQWLLKNNTLLTDQSMNSLYKSFHSQQELSVLIVLP